MHALIPAPDAQIIGNSARELKGAGGYVPAYLEVHQRERITNALLRMSDQSHLRREVHNAKQWIHYFLGHNQKQTSNFESLEER